MSSKQKPQKIIIVTAHPDDAELGMGMKIKNYARNGDVVNLIVATNGEYKSSPKGRRQESIEAAQILGINQCYFLEFKCAQLNNAIDKLRNHIETFIKKEKPDIVYSIFPNDLHIDHSIVSHQTLIAARSVPNLIYFRVAYSQNFIPNCFFFATKELMIYKLRALRCFKRELTRKGTINLEAVQALSKYEYFHYFHHSSVKKIRELKNIKKNEELFFEPFYIERTTLC